MALTLLLALAGCDTEKSCGEGFVREENGNCYPVEETDTDTDTDTDADTDADTDTDTDADTDADTDTDVPTMGLSGLFSVGGYTPDETSVCVITVWGWDQLSESGIPMDGEVGYYAAPITCPTEEDTPEPWHLDVPLDGTLADFGLFANFDGDGDNTTNDDQAGSPVPGGPWTAAEATSFGKLDVQVNVGKPKRR